MFGQKNKCEARNKFVEMYGDEFMGKEVREEVAREIVQSCNDHISKHGMRKMSFSELNGLAGG